jgi:hypothetical protein
MKPACDPAEEILGSTAVWIIARVPGSCSSCGSKTQKGEPVRYDWLTRKLLCGWCGKIADAKSGAPARRTDRLERRPKRSRSRAKNRS